MNKGLLLVISAPSGGGKGTILKELFAQDENLRLSVSATTRRNTASSIISSAGRSSRASSKRGKCWSTPNMWETTTEPPASP